MIFIVAFVVCYSFNTAIEAYQRRVGFQSTPRYFSPVAPVRRKRLSTPVDSAFSVGALGKTLPGSPAIAATVTAPAAAAAASTGNPPGSEQEQEQEYQFESNVARVMDIIINSLYSNKDVFIRELISNAADACDKQRYNAMSSSSAPRTDLRIRVYPDRAANTLTIEDSGIGMNREDLVQNLGKIAESGTNRFVKSIGKENKDAVSLIGQFGVGFYSGFLVANKIEVITKGSAGEQLKWEASIDNLGKYSIKPDPEASIRPIEHSGTRIILHLKDDADQYLDEEAVQTLLEKYSEFISVPIEIQRSITKPITMPVTDMDNNATVTATASGESSSDSGSGDISNTTVSDTLRTKTVMTKVLEWKRVNDKKPLWLRPSKDCNSSDYAEFYRTTFKTTEDPLAQSHFRVEGNVDFRALLFLPADLPFELSRDMFSNAARSMRLYVKRVFINDKFEDLLPRWLLFIRGVVDSDDLPLNVGREILQQSRALRVIKQRLVRRSIDMMTELMRRDEEEFMRFWNNFGRYIKVGILEDGSVREDLVPLVRFFSSHSSVNATSLAEYVNRMPGDQKQIYYVVGETRSQAANTPALERLKNKGYEIIYVSEPIDEMTLQTIDTFAGKRIVDAGKESSSVGDDSQMTEDEKKEKTQKSTESAPLRKWMKDVLGDKIMRVEISTRLVDSPATLVQSEYGASPTMQKYLKSQTVMEGQEREKLASLFNQAILEINMNHPVIQAVSQMHAQQQADSPEAKDIVNMIYHSAALAAGYSLENAADFSSGVIKLMTRLYGPK